MAFVFQNGTLIEIDTDTDKDFFFSPGSLRNLSWISHIGRQADSLRNLVR